MNATAVPETDSLRKKVFAGYLAAICQQFLRKAEFLCRKDPEAQALPTRLCAVLAGRAPLGQTGY
jgi:hypothetical protein